MNVNDLFWSKELRTVIFSKGNICQIKSYLKETDSAVLPQLNTQELSRRNPHKWLSYRVFTKTVRSLASTFIGIEYGTLSEEELDAIRYDEIVELYKLAFDQDVSFTEFEKQIIELKIPQKTQVIVATLTYSFYDDVSLDSYIKMLKAIKMVYEIAGVLNGFIPNGFGKYLSNNHEEMKEEECVTHDRFYITLPRKAD